MRRGKRFDIECRSRMRGDFNKGERDLSVGCSISCPIHTYYPVLLHIPYQIIHTCTLSRFLSIIVSIYPVLRPDHSEAILAILFIHLVRCLRAKVTDRSREVVSTSETRDERTSLHMSRAPDDPSIPISKPSDSETIHSIPIIPVHPPSPLQANEPDPQPGSGSTVWIHRLENDVDFACGGRVRQRGGMGVLLIPLRGFW